MHILDFALSQVELTTRYFMHGFRDLKYGDEIVRLLFGYQQPFPGPQSNRLLSLIEVL